MTPVFPNATLVKWAIIVLTTLGLILYVVGLRSNNASQERTIESQKSVIVVERKSAGAHVLTEKLATGISKAKGVNNEVEINTTIGTHSISFK